MDMFQKVYYMSKKILLEHFPVRKMYDYFA